MVESIIKEIKTKSILVQSKLPASDYVINPYVGCAFGCSYCYASFMGRFVGKSVEDWGNYVFAKVNLPEILDRELAQYNSRNRGTLIPGIEGKSVFLSSVTDPYQGVEQKYKLTRKALKLLLKYKWPGSVGILTKSPLVIRDIDLFKKFPNISVGMTITSTDDNVSRFLERAAPPASLRLTTLKKLHDEGISTYAFVGPILPHFSANPKMLKDIFDSLKEVGVKEIWLEHLNLSPYIKKRLLTKLKGTDRKILAKFYSSQSKNYRDELDKIIGDMLKQYDFRLMMGQAIYHLEK